MRRQTRRRRYSPWRRRRPRISISARLLALGGQCVDRRVERLAVGRGLVELVAHVPGRGEVETELADELLDLLLRGRVLLLAGGLQQLVELAEHLELGGVGPHGLHRLDGGLHLRACRRGDTGAEPDRGASHEHENALHYKSPRFSRISPDWRTDSAPWAGCHALRAARRGGH